MAIFVLLIVPLPYRLKRKLFTFISESPIVAKLQYGMKVEEIYSPSVRASAYDTQITFIFILILFIDSVNRVYRVQVEMSQATKQGGQAGYCPRSTTDCQRADRYLVPLQSVAPNAWKSKLENSTHNATCIYVASLSSSPSFSTVPTS